MRLLPALAAFLLLLGAFPMHVAAPPAKRWTFLVYMDADNNLEQWGIEDFLEMAKVGSTADVNIVVQFDRIAGFDPRYGDWSDTKLFYVTKDLTPDPANALPVALGEVNMADPANLTRFVDWGMQNYPADHYFLVLWDHGDGWQGVVADDDPVPNDRLTAPELRSALAAVVATNGQRIDVIGNDACRMTLEIDDELADYADYFVGSEKDEPLAGWPYDAFLTFLTANPSAAPPDAATALVDRYVESYEGVSAYSVALSVVNAAGLPPLVAALNAFLAEVSSEEPYFTTEVVLARDATEHYEWNSGPGGLEYDLYHFVENVLAGIPSRRVERVGEALEAAIRAAVVYERHWDNPSPINDVHAAHAHGISLYFPTIGGDPQYAALTFSQESAWDEFLLSYPIGTRPQVGLTATAATTDANADGYQDTLVLRFQPATNGTLAVDVYRDGAYVFSRAYVAGMGRTDEVRYAFSDGGFYEVTFYLFNGGTLRNLTVVSSLEIQQPITFRGYVTGQGGALLDGATVTLVDLANGRTATTTTSGGAYAITVAYPTWFREGDSLELRVVAGDREARLGFNASVGDGTVVHDVFLNTVAVDFAPWIAALALLAVIAAAGVTGTLLFRRRLRRSREIP
ncbi:MAG TPA: clostripain-related cysteine peptidase [Thermoplasmata archaeon]|nr:clostripain-related cysteine peptidase [Thermoplasmata archaeon]